MEILEYIVTLKNLFPKYTAHIYSKEIVIINNIINNIIFIVLKKTIDNFPKIFALVETFIELLSTLQNNYYLSVII